MKVVFCDINIFQDVLSGREGYEASLLVLQLVREKRLEGRLASFSIPTLWYLNRRAANAREKIRTVIKGFKVVALTSTMISSVLSESRFGDLEDELQHLCTVKSRSSCLITRNKKDFPEGPVAVATPEEFLDQMNPGHRI